MDMLLRVPSSDVSSGSVLASGPVVSIRVVVELPGQPVEMLLPQMFSGLAERANAIFTWTVMKGSL